MSLSSKTESKVQKEIVSQCKKLQINYPNLELLHHIPNGGSRNMLEAVRLKSEGVKRGVPDLFLPVKSKSGEFCGLYIELKAPHLEPKQIYNPFTNTGAKGGLSDEQIDFAQKVVKHGYYWSVCYDSNQAIDLILKYTKEM